MTLKIVGAMAGIRILDSGSELMTIADLSDGSSVRVISTPGINNQPSEYAHIGDELLIVGDVHTSRSTPVIYARSDGVTVVRESAQVLTVPTVSANWILFENDLIRLKGVLGSSGPGTGLRLYDSSGSCSIAVLPSDLDLGNMIGATVTLTATLFFDHRLSALALAPSYAVGE